MFRIHRTATLVTAILMMLISGSAAADKYDETVELFRNGGDLSLIHISEPTRPY